jgi:dTDP-4-amino-4,6-dideoxygalactose transaminase
MQSKKKVKQTQMLALYGGTPVLAEGPPSWPTADPDVGDALRTAWADGSWGTYHGTWLDRLTAKLSEMHARDFVLPCSSGTYAVEAALRGLGVEKDDEVVLAAYDFPGNFRAIEQIGARPVLIDIAEENWSLNPKLLDAVCSPAVRAVIVSHLHGRLAPIEAIENWAQSRGVALIEDACQVPGAKIGNRTAGSFGDVSVLSFGGSKLLTAGRGGALLTCREDIYQRAKIFGHRGNDAFPLSQLQATVLLPQLEVLEERNRQRGQAVDFLLQQREKWSGLQAFSFRAEDAQPSYYKLGWLYTGDTLEGPSRELFLRALQSEGLAIDSGFRGFAHRSERRCRRPVPLPFSERAAKSTVLMHHPILLADQSTLTKIAEAFDKIHAAFFG